MEHHPFNTPNNFEGFETLYSMVKFKKLGNEIINNRYQIVELLGAGGMGDVYKAFDLKEKRNVALKRLMPPVNSKQRKLMESRFLTEVSSLEAIYSPYVVEIYDAFKLDCYYYLVMEFIDGKPLEDLVKETYNTQKQFSTLEYVSIMLKLARGLEAIHIAGIIHHDIKPANIMINRVDDIVKILDLGLSSNVVDSNESEGFTGTVSYMSPEQLIGNKIVTTSSDIFSLGCTFYYMMTKKLPFEGDGIQCMIQICETTPTAPHKLNLQIPKQLSKCVMKTMAKDPKDRYRSASSLAESIEKLRHYFMTNLSDIFSPNKENTLCMSMTKRLTAYELHFLKKIATLNSNCQRKKIEAVINLGRLRDKKAVKPLLSLLGDEKNLSNHKLICQLILSLRKIGDMNAVEPIRNILHTTSNGRVRKVCQKNINALLDEKHGILYSISLYYDKFILKLEETLGILSFHCKRYTFRLKEWYQEVRDKTNEDEE